MLDTLKQKEIFVLAFHLFESLTGLQSIQLNESDRSDVLNVVANAVYTGVLITTFNREVDGSRNASFLEDQVL